LIIRREKMPEVTAVNIRYRPFGAISHSQFELAAGGFPAALG